MASDWHTGDRLRHAVEAVCCRQESTDIFKAKCLLHEIVSEIDRKFRYRGISHHVEYVGSCYEGLNVATNEEHFNFEVLMIIDSHGFTIETSAAEDISEYYKLELKNPDIITSGSITNKYTFFGFLAENSLLDPQRFREKFFEELQNCLQNSAILNTRLKLRLENDISCLEVFSDDGSFPFGPSFLTVKLLPAYEIRKDLYVPSELITKEKSTNSLAWSKTFSVKEKCKMEYFGINPKLNKQVLVTLKAIRDAEPGLDQLSSFILKDAIFLEMDKSLHNWTEFSLTKRVIAVLRSLNDHLKNQKLPHYFVPGRNLLKQIPKATIETIQNSVDCLLTSENRMITALTPWQNENQFQEYLRNFLNIQTKQLTSAINESKNKCQEYLSLIQNALPPNYRFECIGSAFQGISISKCHENSNDVDYEVLLVMEEYVPHLKAFELSTKNDEFHLEPGSEHSAQYLRKILSYQDLIFGFLRRETFVDPVKVAVHVEQCMRNCILKTAQLRAKVYVQRDNCFVILNIYPWSGKFLKGRRLCQVKIVPSFLIGDALFAAKSVDGVHLSDRKAWRRSYDLEERQLWKSDSGNECRKNVFKLIEFLRIRDDHICNLTRHDLKMVLFKTFSEKDDWRGEKLAERFLDVLENLHLCLKNRCLSDYFVPERNLLAGREPAIVKDVRERIKKICSDKSRIIRLLSH